jgi:hypothetical protein
MPDKADIRISDAGALPGTFAAVHGPDKVAQRFIYFLLTPYGTVPGAPTVGTEFVDSIGLYRSEFDLFADFFAAEPMASAGVRSCESSADDPSCRLGAARLDRVTISDGAVTFDLTIVAADGSAPTSPVSFSVEV